MPTIVCWHFMSRTLFNGILTFMSRKIFILSWAHMEFFYNLGARHALALCYWALFSHLFSEKKKQKKTVMIEKIVSKKKRQKKVYLSSYNDTLKYCLKWYVIVAVYTLFCLIPGRRLTSPAQSPLVPRGPKSNYSQVWPLSGKSSSPYFKKYNFI